MGVIHLCNRVFAFELFNWHGVFASLCFANCTHQHHHSESESVKTITTRRPAPKKTIEFISVWKQKWVVVGSEERERERERENERRLSVLFAKGIGVRRSRGIRPRQLRMAFPIRRRSPHPRLDLLQSPLLQRPLPLRTLSVSLSLSPLSLYPILHFD